MPNAYTWVQQGTVNADTGWVCTSDPGGTLGTTSITFVLFAAAQDVQNVARYYSNGGVHAGGTTITIPQTTHSLRASRGIHVQVQDTATGTVQLPDVAVAANGDVTVTFAVTQTANTILVTLIG